MEPTQSQCYEVSPGGCISVPNATGLLRGNRLLQPGELVPLDKFEPDEIERLARQGKIRTRGAQLTQAPRGERNRSPGRWRFDPRTLIDLDLERLNVMISEMDPQHPLADTAEAAILILSADFDEEFNSTPSGATISAGSVQMAQTNTSNLDR